MRKMAFFGRGASDLAEPDIKSLLILLDDLFQFVSERNYGNALHLRASIGVSRETQIVLGPLVALCLIVFAEVPAAAFLTLDSCERDDLGDVQHVLEIERRVPAGI